MEEVVGVVNGGEAAGIPDVLAFASFEPRGGVGRVGERGWCVGRWVRLGLGEADEGGLLGPNGFDRAGNAWMWRAEEHRTR